MAIIKITAAETQLSKTNRSMQNQLFFAAISTLNTNLLLHSLPE
jgi:hypothetical protein